jgi:chemotaxis protein methyltransferase WspC
MRILSALRRLTGMNLARSTVEQAMKRRMQATGQTLRKAYIDTVDEEELRALVELVVVPESWLFRDPQAFAAAAAFVRQRLADGARLVRILSLPCAGGEEPYSMAMALSDAGAKPQSYMIDAVDISAACLARAQAGVFGRNAFRSKDLSFRDRHFTALGDDEYRINDELRERIRFSQGNILEGPLGTARQYDVVFCRNLLIYFDDPTTAAAIARLSSHLADDGMLLVGHAEVPSAVRHGFASMPHRQAFALRKAMPAGAVRPATPARSRREALAQPGEAGPSSRRSAVARARTNAPPPSPAAAATPAAPASAAVPRAPSRPVAPTAQGARQAPAPETAGGGESLLEHARALANAGKLVEADSACRELLAQQPQSAEAYFILGLLAESAGRQAEAEAQLKRCLYLQPDHYEALCHLALLQEQGGNSSAAATLKARAARVFQRQQPPR